MRAYPSPGFHSGLWLSALLALGMLSPAAYAQPRPPASLNQAALAPASAGATQIAAIVNDDVISFGDVENRRRLFALSTGLPITNDVLNRLTGQVTRQLIDERLRLQEAQRRHVVVQDVEIAQAIHEIESRNNMRPGQLAKQLNSNGVEMRTLIDQFRVQIAWGRVLHQMVIDKGEPSDADIADQLADYKSQIGQPEYHIGEIFTPVVNPSADGEARRFVDTVIQQLRAGAPFPMIAAQFSQSQTALQGGDLGWMKGNDLDPAVLRVAKEMPMGAVSNPIKVPGGYSIIMMNGKRDVGKDVSTVLHVRQAWLPFTSKLDPREPTEQQLNQLEVAKRISATASSCAAIEAANAKLGNVRPADPGEIHLEGVGNPVMHELLSSLIVGKPSQPLPNEDGISILMVCSREEVKQAEPQRAQILEKIFSDRLELAARQLMRDLQRRAVIDKRA